MLKRIGDELNGVVDGIPNLICSCGLRYISTKRN